MVDISGTFVCFNEKIFFAFLSKVVNFIQNMFVHHHGNGIMITVYNDISGCVNFKNAFGNQISQIFFLLYKLGGIIGIDLKN